MKLIFYMPKVFTSEKQKIGEIGENIAVKFLMKHNFYILERNYTKKWGEIDIIAEKRGKIYFIEVKSVSRENFDSVIHETNLEEHRPEENVHPWKIKRMYRTIQTYLLSKNIPEEREWQVDLLIVYMDLKNKKAKVKTLEDIVI
jgi:putative endonuclease